MRLSPVKLYATNELSEVAVTYGNKKEYAAHRGCSAAYISKKGIKELVEQAIETDPSDGKTKINFEKADALIRDTGSPAHQAAKESAAEIQAASSEVARPAPAPGSIYDSKERIAKINAEKAEMELLERKRELMPVNQTIAAIKAAGATIKEYMQARNMRLAEQAATMTNPREIKAMLDADDLNLFETINNDFQRRVEEYIGGDNNTH